MNLARNALLTTTLALAITAAVSISPGASAATSAKKGCVQFGVYQDKPEKTLNKLQKRVKPGVSVVSTYLTAGKLLSPTLIRLANKRNVSLMVTWLPDGGKDGAAQPKFRLAQISKGKYDASLKALARQFKQVKKGVIFRPMPEMNTQWYAWSGTANKNKPKKFVPAWKRVHKTIRKAGGKKKQVKFLWSPYARSIPDTGKNAINAYFPGKKFVDYTGAVGYNFGKSASGLAWTEPVGLFSQAYTTIQALAKKPFWIAETGSTQVGGNKGAWIKSIATLKSTMPMLKGVVWLDAKAGTRDFRITGKPVNKAFKALLKKKGCR